MFWRAGTRRFSDAMHPYSIARRAGGFLFVSGQLGIAGGEKVQGGIAPETEQAFRNLELALADHGLGLGDVVKMTVYLASLRDRRRMDEVYSRILSAPLPARTCFAVGALPYRARVEIDAIACLRSPGDGTSEAHSQGIIGPSAPRSPRPTR